MFFAPPHAPVDHRHLMLAFAHASAPPCQTALEQLSTPHLDALLGRLTLAHTDVGDDYQLSPPHERALAQALGLLRAHGQPYGDGLIPWAAAQSAQPEVPQAWFVPCHFEISHDEVRLLPSDQIGITDAHARPLFDALVPYCAQDGIHLRYDCASRWHASGPLFRELECASIDRVSGRSLQGWMPQSQRHPSAVPTLLRLQSEIQMLFYTHPVNDLRESLGLHTINGIWISGAGDIEAPARGPAPSVTYPHMPQALRLAALQANWPAWQAAWTYIDTAFIKPLLHAARQGEPVTLTLCGERSAQRWISAPASLSGRLARLLSNLPRPAPARHTLLTL